MPTHTKILAEKRMQFFLEHCQNKRNKSRVDVDMDNLEALSEKEIYDLKGKMF